MSKFPKISLVRVTVLSEDEKSEGIFFSLREKKDNFVFFFIDPRKDKEKSFYLFRDRKRYPTGTTQVQH